MTSRFQTLFNIWSSHIPLVSAMAIEFHENGPDWYLEAPLEPNSNHMGTGFGGSIASLATLAGWAQTWMLLPSPEDVNIVIANSSIRYLKPATGSLIATAVAPEHAAVERFLNRLEQRERAGIELDTHVHSNGVAAATLKGKFIATLKTRSTI